MNKLKYAVKTLFKYDYGICTYKENNSRYHSKYSNLLMRELNQDLIDVSVERYKVFERFFNRNELICYVIMTIGA